MCRWLYVSHGSKHACARSWLRIDSTAPPPTHTRAPQALAQNQDDAFTSSSWANPRSLKQHFSGISAVRLPH